VSNAPALHPLIGQYHSCRSASTATSKHWATIAVTGHGHGSSPTNGSVASITPSEANVLTPIPAHGQRSATTRAALCPTDSTIASAGGTPYRATSSGQATASSASARKQVLAHTQRV